jgi:AcrR family transcriptional regulator
VVTAGPDSTTRIVDAALRLMIRHGEAKVAMVDVCREAAVSRSTLYRAFATREELVDAMGPRIIELYRATVQHAVEKDPAPERRFRVVVHAVNTFVKGGVGREMQVREGQVEFVLAQFRDNWGSFVGPIREAIVDAFPPVTTRRHRIVVIAAELIASTSFAQRMLPARIDEGALVEVLDAYAASVAG